MNATEKPSARLANRSMGGLPRPDEQRVGQAEAPDEYSHAEGGEHRANADPRASLNSLLAAAEPTISMSREGTNPIRSMSKPNKTR